MSNEKFTKGPWFADLRGGCCAVYPEIRKGDTNGCMFEDDRNIYYSTKDNHYNGRHWDMSEEAQANAHLIAAAPEMYELLNAWVDSYECVSGDYQSSIVDETIELLAKARGES